MKMRTLVITLVLAAALKSNVTSPFIGGNQFNTYYTSPNLINNFLAQINGPVAPACAPIPGIGQPILAIKKLLQTVDSSLDTTNRNTNAKVIFFRKRKNARTRQTTYKMVITVKTFTTTNFIAVEGVYKQIGFPTFEVITYYVDNNIENVRKVLGEYTIDPNGFVGCGNIKAIFSQANPVLPKPSVKVKGQQTNPSLAPYAQGNQLINEGPAKKHKSSGQLNAEVIANILKLLQNKS